MKAARSIGHEKMSISVMRSYKEAHGKQSVLSEVNLVERAVQNAHVHVFSHLKTLNESIADSQNTRKSLEELISTWPESAEMGCFLRNLLKAFDEDLKLRKAIREALVNSDSHDAGRLSNVMVLCSELEEFAIARAASDCPGLPRDIDSFKKMLRDKINPVNL